MSIPHCVATIARIVAEDRADPRSLLQLGYNLGRLSELTGLGRAPFWDRWKEPVAQWDRATLRELARDLQNLVAPIPHDSEPDALTRTPSGD